MNYLLPSLSCFRSSKSGEDAQNGYKPSKAYGSRGFFSQGLAVWFDFTETMGPCLEGFLSFILSFSILLPSYPYRPLIDAVGLAPCSYLGITLESFHFSLSSVGAFAQRVLCFFILDTTPRKPHYKPFPILHPVCNVLHHFHWRLIFFCLYLPLHHLVHWLATAVLSILSYWTLLIPCPSSGHTCSLFRVLSFTSYPTGWDPVSIRL